MSQSQAADTAAKRDTLAANLAQARAAVGRAQAALDLARQDQTHTVIRAPIDGVVGDRQVEPGDYVQPGTHLLSLVPIRSLYVTANFKETQVSRMLVGQAATIKVDALPGRALKGEVEKLRPGIQPRSSRCFRSSRALATSPRSSSASPFASASIPVRPASTACVPVYRALSRSGLRADQPSVNEAVAPLAAAFLRVNVARSRGPTLQGGCGMTLDDYREDVRARLAAEVCDALARDQREIELHVRFQIQQDIASFEACINYAEDRAEAARSRDVETHWRDYGARQIARIRELLAIRRELDTQH